MNPAALRIGTEPGSEVFVGRHKWGGGGVDDADKRLWKVGPLLVSRGLQDMDQLDRCQTSIFLKENPIFSRGHDSE